MNNNVYQKLKNNMSIFFLSVSPMQTFIVTTIHSPYLDK